ncbi:MAG: hypothetical protein WCF85_16040 [Rhodospirillaceae bacterium]
MNSLRTVLRHVVPGIIVLTITVGGFASADGVSESVLRSQNRATEQAIENQVQQVFRPAPPSSAAPSGGPQMVMNPGGVVVHTGPGPGTPVLGHLGAGASVVVTRPVGNTGWAEIMSEGRLGYVWAPQLSPSGFPPSPAGGER